MPYSFTSTVAAALLRVQNFYNGLSYDPSSNPGGYDQDGHRVNFVPTLRDIATIGGGFAKAGTDIQGYLGSAQQAVTDVQGQVDVATAQATAAATSATAAAASYDSFDDRYLGAKATAPTLDNDGDALVVGTLFYKTGAQPGMRVWDGAAWQFAYAQITGGVTSFKGRAGDVTPQAGDYTAKQIAGLAAFIDVDHFFFAGI